MRVYVAGRWTRRAEAWAFMRSLEARGHSITHDWTIKEDQPELPEAERAEFYRDCAEDDVTGALEAEVFVLLHDPGCRGAFVELGLALAEGARIVVVGGGTCPVTQAPIFYWLPEVRHVADEDGALALVDELARVAA